MTIRGEIMKIGIIKKKWFGIFAVFLVGLIGMQGCATAPMQTDYLGNDFALMPDHEDSSLLWWEKSEFNWNNYNKVILDPVSIRSDAAINDGKFNSEDLESLRGNLKDATIEELGPEFPVVNTPGTDVLRIRAAITEINTSNTILNLITTVAVFVPMDMGGASIEVEFFDSMTGERLAAMADCKTGTPLQLKSAFSRFGQTKKVFNQWAEELKLALVNNP